MITKELIARINTLAQKQKQTGLSEAEKQEQARLRREYLDGIKEQVRGQLDALRDEVHDADMQADVHLMQAFLQEATRGIVR